MTSNVIVIIEERTSLPYAKLIPVKNYDKVFLRMMGDNWISNYIKSNNYHYNPFYSVVLSSSDKYVKSIKRVYYVE